MNDTKDIHEKVTELQASQEDITLRQQQSIENQRLEIVSKAILKVVIEFSKSFISKDQVKQSIENQGREIVSKANLKAAVELSKYLFQRTK